MSTLSSLRDYPLHHPATEGHFAGHPIIPGVVILSDVLASIRSHIAKGLPPNINDKNYGVRAAKFLRPVFPGQQMVISLRVGGNADANTEKSPCVIHFDCFVENAAVAKGTFEFAATDV